MQGNTLKFILDSLTFTALTSTAATGCLLGFFIPAGERVPSQEKYFLGLHRHTWGDIHLVMAIIFLILLGFHLYLNWSWIVGQAKHHFGERWKQFLYVLCGLWILVLILARAFAK